MEDAYNLLLKNKLENESFSDEVRRILSKKGSKNLSDFFGIISEEEGEAMLKDLKMADKKEIEFLKKGLK